MCDPTITPRSDIGAARAGAAGVGLLRTVSMAAGNSGTQSVSEFLLDGLLQGRYVHLISDVLVTIIGDNGGKRHRPMRGFGGRTRFR